MGGMQFVFTGLTIILFVVVIQSVLGLQDCPDNKDYGFVVDELMNKVARRKREVSWSVNCAVTSLHETGKEVVVIHKRYDCCKTCERKFILCRIKDMEFVCKKRALECSCRCRNVKPYGDSNEVRSDAGRVSCNDIKPSLRIRRQSTAVNKLFGHKNTGEYKHKQMSCFVTDCSEGRCCRRKYCTKVMNEETSPDSSNGIAAAH